jgi:hypothetical protein
MHSSAVSFLPQAQSAAAIKTTDNIFFIDNPFARIGLIISYK